MCMDGVVYKTVSEVRGGTCDNLRVANNIVAYVTAVTLRQGGVKKVSL
jgi:hypothetical protein